MAQRTLAALAAACCLAGRALASAEEGACVAGDKDCAAQDGLPRDQVLMQSHALELKMKARVAATPKLQATLLQSDAKIAGVLMRSRMDPSMIGSVVQKGLAAVMEAVKLFMVKPLDLGNALDVLGRGLLDAITTPVRAAFNDEPSFVKFEQEWMKFFDTAAAAVPHVASNITKYQEEGNPECVIIAISDILELLADGVVQFVPHATAMEVVKYVDAVADMLGAIGGSWTKFETGKEAEAIEDLYFAMRGVLDTVLPESVRNDETYNLIIGTLDNVMGDLSKTVLDFQRQITEGAVCWKVQENRPKQRPTVCQEGFYWNGEQFCLPKPTEQDTSLLETAVARKVDGAAEGKVPIPDGAMVAHCETGGEYPEKMGHWCYALCPATMEPKGVTCKTRCGGEFPADDGAMMCGHSQGVLIEAVMNMVVSVSTSAINAGLMIADMAKNGVSTDSLTSTINAFVAMGKPFAYGTCPK